MDDSNMQRIRRRRQKRGQCESCGIKTHKVSCFGRRRKPLTVDGRVLFGRCLFCYPLEGNQETESYLPIPGLIGVNGVPGAELLSLPSWHQESDAAGSDNSANQEEQEVGSATSDVTLDNCFLSEEVWDELPTELQKHLSQECVGDSEQEKQACMLPPFLVYEGKGRLIAKHDIIDSSCCICTSESTDPANVASIDGCKHLFCFHCIEQWAECENTCPLCKSRFHKIIRANAKLWTKNPVEDSVAKMVPNRKQTSNDNISMATFQRRAVAAGEALDTTGSFSSVEWAQFLADISAYAGAQVGQGANEYVHLGRTAVYSHVDNIEQNMEYEDEYESYLMSQQE